MSLAVMFTGYEWIEFKFAEASKSLKEVTNIYKIKR
jgi:hypothetical protein